MPDDLTDFREQIPEADLLEQQTPVDPLSADDGIPATPSAENSGDANESDRLEQQAVIPDDEDDYPRDASAAT